MRLIPRKKRTIEEEINLTRDLPLAKPVVVVEERPEKMKKKQIIIYESSKET
jgi:hypothetical protein